MEPKETQHFAIGQVVKEAWVCMYVFFLPNNKKFEQDREKTQATFIASFSSIPPSKIKFIIHIMPRLA